MGNGVNTTEKKNDKKQNISQEKSEVKTKPDPLDMPNKKIVDYTYVW